MCSRVVISSSDEIIWNETKSGGQWKSRWTGKGIIARHLSSDNVEPRLVIIDGVKIHATSLEPHMTASAFSGTNKFCDKS
jgi:hypothetical protein